LRTNASSAAFGTLLSSGMCPQRDGAHVNGAEWLVEEAEDGLRVSTVGPRAYQAQRQPVGALGRVVTGRCECGSLDPRIRLG
jgi:hypothetical protein